MFNFGVYLYLALCVKINDYNVMGFYICLFLYNSNLNALWSRGKQICGMKTPRAMYVAVIKAQFGRLTKSGQLIRQVSCKLLLSFFYQVKVIILT